LTSAVDELGSIDDFVGHPAESTFVIITVPNKGAHLSQSVGDRLKQAMTYFYPIHDREAGYVTRSGEEKVKVPFMSLSTVLLSPQDGTFPDAEKVREALNQTVKV
jgi:hypothetical protein